MIIILARQKSWLYLTITLSAESLKMDLQKPEVDEWRIGKSLKLSCRGVERNQVIAFIAFLFKDGSYGMILCC